MKFDELLVHLGEFGRYQKFIFATLCIPSFLGALSALSVLFILDIPKHRCSLGVNDTWASQGEDHAHLVNVSIPWEKDEESLVRSSCYMYTTPNINPPYWTNDTVKCSSWVFDKSNYQSTLIEEFEMVCDDRMFRSHFNMAGFAGMLCGTISLGILADIFGRRPVFLVAMLTNSVFTIALAFAPNIYVYMVLRALGTFTTGGAFVVNVVLFMELTGPSKRTFVGIVVEVAWGVGLFVLALLAYFIRAWQTLQIVLAIPTVVYIGYIWIIPESPRWLISRGRLEEAKVIIRKMAEFNRAEITPDMYEKLTVDTNKEQAKVTQMFTHRSLLIMTLIIYFNWCVVSMVYYGLGLNVQNLSGDIYLNFTIANIMEMLSYVACLLLLDRLGRKILHCGCMLVGGVACLATIFPVIYGTSAISWVTTMLAMIGKFGASGAFAIIFVFTTELFPTTVRNSGLGSSSFCARIGGMVSPYIADLGVIIGGDLKVALPLIVFGGASVAAGILALYLPETLNKKLPETIEDAKNFRKSGDKSKYVMNGGHVTGVDNVMMSSYKPGIDDNKC